MPPYITIDKIKENTAYSIFSLKKNPTANPIPTDDARNFNNSGKNAVFRRKSRMLFALSNS